MVRLVFTAEGVLLWEPQQEVFRDHVGKLWKGFAEQAIFFFRSGVAINNVLLGLVSYF